MQYTNIQNTSKYKPLEFHKVMMEEYCLTLRLTMKQNA